MIYDNMYNIHMYVCMSLDELCEAGQNLATLAMEKQILADRYSVCTVYSVHCTGTVQYIVQIIRL